MSDSVVQDRQAPKTDLQRQQSELVDRGERLPGVADALAAYRKFAPHVPTTSARPQPPVVYSTGGNA